MNDAQPRGVPSPTDGAGAQSQAPGTIPVLAPEKGEDPWAWNGPEALVLTGAGAFVLQREAYYRFAAAAIPEDFRRIFGETGRALVRPGGHRMASLQLVTPIPIELLSQTVSFFRAAWERYRTEDILLLYYFPQKHRYALVHPELRHVSGIDVGYEVPDTPEGALLFGTFHSHGAAQADHSPTDTQDVSGVPGLHLVVGDVDLPVPTIVCALSTGRAVYRVSVGDLFTEAAPRVAFPKTWLKRRWSLPRVGDPATAPDAADKPAEGKEGSDGR